MLKITSLNPKKRRVVAVSWENRELLCLVASGFANNAGGESWQLEHSLRVFCDDDMTDEEAATVLRDKLKDKRVSSFELLIALPRSQVDVITLTLPPATESELPLLVRNEIMRQSAEVTENSLIDYEAPSGSSTDEALTIDGAVVRGDAHARIETLATALQQKPARIVVRAHAIASMFRRQVPQPPECSLLVNLMRASADISVLNNNDITFTRNVQLGTEDDATPAPDASHLADELRLTMIVAPQSAQRPEAQARCVYMFGDAKESEEFREQLEQESQLNVTVLDPLEGVKLPTGSTPPTGRNRLAALVGMVWDYLDGASLIDFANPKQPPPKPNTARKAAFYAAAIAAVVAIVGFRLQSDVSEAQQQAADLQTEVDHTEKLLETVNAQTIVLDAVERWRQDQTDWLGELHYLSTKMPPSEKAVVQRLTLAPTASGAGLISMSVRVDEPSVIKVLESGLRDSRHDVRSQRIAPAGGGDSAVQFETRVEVLPPPRSPTPNQ